MANVVFDSLNDALASLPYARVYQSPFDDENEFHMEVRNEKGGSYSALKELIELAKKDGFKLRNYYEMDDIFGNYNYTAEMYSDKTVECGYSQDRVYVVD